MGRSRAVGEDAGGAAALVGRSADLVVSFTSAYVFVPALRIFASGLMPEVLAIPAGVSSSSSPVRSISPTARMKTDDGFLPQLPGSKFAAFYVLQPR